MSMSTFLLPRPDGIRHRAIMRHPLMHGAVLTALFYLASCAPSTYPLFLNTELKEADNLRAYCEKNGIQSIDVQKADSLTVAARTKRTEGKENEAYWMADASATYYRLAIARHELGLAEKKIAELQKQLATARDQLNTYKEVLTELEEMRNR